VSGKYCQSRLTKKDRHHFAVFAFHFTLATKAKHPCQNHYFVNSNSNNNFLIQVFIQH